MRARILSSLVLLVCGVLLALVLWSIGFPTINSDGYYYLTVARNFTETGTFTYDTIHSTNGFHWAWMGLLIAASSLIRVLGFALDGPVLVGITVVVSCTFYIAAARQLADTLSQTRQPAEVKQVAPLLAGLVFLEPNLINLSINGLETSLFLFLLLRLVRLLSDDRPFVHESLIGTQFRGRLAGRTAVGEYQAIVPEIEGSAWITGEHTFLVDDADPLGEGFRI